MKNIISIFLTVIVYGTILFSCDKEEISKSSELKGQWKWLSTCGGVVGCRYATDTTNDILIIDYNRLIGTKNGDTVSTFDCQIKNISIENNSRIYTLELSNGLNLNATVKNDTLGIDYDTPIFSAYKRVN